MRLTTAQYQEILIRQQHNAGRNPTPPDAVERESDLHDQIINYCKSKGWLAIHSRMDRKQTSNVGCPDFLIFADHCRVFAFEAKRKGGKATPVQLATLHWLSSLGHTTGVVYNLEQVIAIIAET